MQFLYRIHKYYPINYTECYEADTMDTGTEGLLIDVGYKTYLTWKGNKLGMNIHVYI